METARMRNLLTAVLVCGTAAGLAVTPDAGAQSEESQPAPALGEYEAAPLPPPERPYLLPDLPQTRIDQAQLKKDWFTLKFGTSAVLDYSAFTQDAASISQVGKQDDQWQIRELRLTLHGSIASDYKVNYFITGAYKSFDSDPQRGWDPVDFWLSFPLGSPATKLIVGKQKETFDYEVVSSFPTLAQQERILDPFFVTRDIGAKITQVLFSQRMTLSAGAFNGWWAKHESLGDSGTDASARITGLVWDQADGRRFFHLGIAGRYVGADNNTLRYKGRPESNVTDDYVDTGNLPADHAWHLGLECLWNEGPFSVLAEYNRAWVESPVKENPQFSGYYILASWILTGETRPYDRTLGYTRRIVPKGRWGAPEIVARFSRVDLDDGVVQGGKYDKTYLGINWWASRMWKFGFGWGHTWLDRFGKTGITDSFLTRAQFVF